MDHPSVMRNSKIYIDNRDCESDATKSELDLLKDFFDLSLQSAVATTGETADHALLDNHVRAGRNLDFILNSDVSPKKYTTWIPIGYNNIADDPTTPNVDEAVANDGQCFDGTFHGDGYTISGLSNSLFNHLCGEVYNLGVTGTFEGAGIAETGGGYVENCWINTTAENVNNVKAVFGNPSDASRKQTVNCYYPDTKSYAAGDAHRMTETEFYNGTVAYNLNGFYLNKRYHDRQGLTSGRDYKYLKWEDGSLSKNLIAGYYPASSEAQYGVLGYVEGRYGNVDFIYAGGTIPEANDIRMRTTTTTVNDVPVTTVSYAPIWPDDYIYFGQKLTYDPPVDGIHQDVPGHITNTTRVYRAPAYFRNSTMSAAHFNSDAVIPAKSMPKTPTDTDLKDAYPNMTAIDFAGYQEGTEKSAYTLGYHSNLFYQPLLDDEGLNSINTRGQTPNLLVYAPAVDVNEKTHDVLNGYYADEPQYGDCNEESTAYNDGSNYNRVAKADASKVVGHLIQATDGKPTATNDHLLVDKQDFYCPIAYTFDDDSRMWYQRTPDNYVDRLSGWETISLPFKVETVTTDKKGELTHFYEGSKTGHEYWLREYNDMESANNELTAMFGTLAKASGNNPPPKTVNNTFLWDIFYKGLHSQQDANEDEYQEYYSKDERVYEKYPRMMAGTPYLIGFPGETYYEFDLSGNFKAETTSSGNPDTITVSRQILTFASDFGAEVDASDHEQGTTYEGYLFKTSYLNESLTGNNWVLNAKNDQNKSSFDKTPATATAQTPAISVLPFRPYFAKPSTSSNPAPKHAFTRIHISSDSGIDINEKDTQDNVAESMEFYTKKNKVVVTSHMRSTADVGIFNVSGMCVASFNIEPGETVETPVYNSGVYIIRAGGGHYTKKVSVK